MSSLQDEQDLKPLGFEFVTAGEKSWTCSEFSMPLCNRVFNHKCFVIQERLHKTESPTTTVGVAVLNRRSHLSKAKALKY